MNKQKGYRLTRQKRAHGSELFRLRVWKKRVYVDGVYVELKVGERQWLFHPYDKRYRR